jgi:hypothetical protein
MSAYSFNTCMPQTVCRTSNTYGIGGRRQWSRTEFSRITAECYGTALYRSGEDRAARSALRPDFSQQVLTTYQTTSARCRCPTTLQ